MNRKAFYLLGAAVGAVTLNGAGHANEVTTFTYDALGRLVGVATSGGPNNGLAVGTTYDPAGNRANYNVSASGAPPPPGNQPPSAAIDGTIVPTCASGNTDVLENDSDPDGNYPLALVSIVQGTLGTATIVDSRTIGYQAGSQTGTDVIGYTVRDSLNATSSSTLTVYVTQGTC